MSFIQIPNLPSAVNLSGSEQVEVVQGGVSLRATTGQIAGLLVNTPVTIQNVTKYQFFTAIPLASPPGDPNLLFQAIPPDFSNAATVQFYCSDYVRAGSALYTLCQTTYGYTNVQMDNLMAVALVQSLWG